MTLLRTEEIEEKLKHLPNWTQRGSEIVREFDFKDFVKAMQFVNMVAEQAEAAGHHPDIDIRYNKVKLVLASHDAGGLTERDFQLAGSIDQIPT
jgi:4a-hydroxytetrahydrobiopterin dehydratase